jgi:hypothetical protein
MHELSVALSEVSNRTNICVEKEEGKTGIRILVADSASSFVDVTLTPKGARQLINALLEALLEL